MGQNLTFIQFGVRILQDVAGNTRLISTVGNILFEIIEQLGKVRIASHTKLIGRRILLTPDPE